MSHKGFLFDTIGHIVGSHPAISSGSFLEVHYDPGFLLLKPCGVAGLIFPSNYTQETKIQRGEVPGITQPVTWKDKSVH